MPALLLYILRGEKTTAIAFTGGHGHTVYEAYAYETGALHHNADIFFLRFF